MTYKNNVDYNALIDKAMRYIVKLALQKVQKIKNDIHKFPRIIGIKIYLGYQKFYANILAK